MTYAHALLALNDPLGSEVEATMLVHRGDRAIGVATAARVLAH